MAKRRTVAAPSHASPSWTEPTRRGSETDAELAYRSRRMLRPASRVMMRLSSSKSSVALSSTIVLSDARPCVGRRERCRREGRAK